MSKPVYIVRAYFLSDSRDWSFHPGETLDEEAMAARGLMTRTDAGVLVPTPELRERVRRSEVELVETEEAPAAPGDSLLLFSEAGANQAAAADPEPPAA